MVASLCRQLIEPRNRLADCCLSKGVRASIDELAALDEDGPDFGWGNHKGARQPLDCERHQARLGYVARRDVFTGGEARQHVVRGAAAATCAASGEDKRAT